MSRASIRVDRSAIAANCARLRAAAGPHSRLCAVVKADGYGHGMIEVANTALAGGASMLAVAAGSEALALRTNGIEAPVLVMGAVERDEIAPLVEAECELVTWSKEFSEAAKAAAGDGGNVRLHVKFDTGMGRLGTADASLARDLAVDAHESANATLAGAMTHLATADDPTQWDFARKQLDLFGSFASEVKAIDPEAIAHAANSAATLAIEGSAFDMVRCGVAVYGMDPFGADPREQGLVPALELTSHVAAVKEIPAGASVGYGRKFVASGPTRVASVPIGYADGFRRALGGKARAIVNGRLLPVVGNVSMDNLSIDLGPDDQGDSVGDEVVLIGDRGGARILIEELAREAQTINYEIATGLGGRAKRSHHG